MNLKTIKKWLQEHHGALAIVLAVVGGVFYLSQSWAFAHTLPSIVWDEGMYLFKGYAFASGQYHPFEDFGLWTNQLPVSYYSPGVFQVLFGVGIGTGRVYAVIVGLLTVVGMWLTAKRQGNVWWGTAVVWVFALNVGWIKAYSMVLSQGLVSLFFAWMLAFASGKYRRNWELGLAALFASLAGLTRINVLPVVFIFVLYVFWQYGKKSGLIAAAFGIIPVVFVHLVYWPDILKIWAYWIPPEIYAGIVEYRSPWREIFLPADFSWWPITGWIDNPDHLAWKGVTFFIQALRANFVSWFGVTIVLIFWPRKDAWHSEQHKKTTLFLLVTYLVMFSVHFWAAMGGKTCYFTCLPGYMLFFNFFGMMAFISAFPVLRKGHRVWRVIFAIALVLLVFWLFHFDYSSDFLSVRQFIVYDLFGAEVDRMQDKAIRQMPETKPFWRFWEERFGFSRYRYLRFIFYNELMQTAFRWISIFFFGLILPALVWQVLRKKFSIDTAYSRFSMVFVLGFAALFSSSPFYAQALNFNTCDENVVSRYEEVGTALAQEIEPGSRVFWDVKTDVLLLYLPEREIFLPQTNYRFTLTNDSQADWEELQRFGWWNQPLGEEWITQTDYAVVENRFYDSIWKWDQRVENGEFGISEVTRPSELCLGPKTEIVVLESKEKP